MSTSLLSVVTAFSTQLARIQTDNGFATDAGKIVDLLRERMGDDDPCPRIALLIGEAPEKVREQVNAPHVTMRAVLVIVAYVTDDDSPDGPLAALDAVEKDVIRAVCQRSWLESMYASGDIEAINYLTTIPWPRVSGGRIANVDVIVEVKWNQELIS